MLRTNRKVEVVLIELLMLVSLWPDCHESLIITSVLAGDKKFKTISFDSHFLKPLTFEKDLPDTTFRRHRTLRPPKFDIDVNIPIKLPLEDEYPQEEYKKPVESQFFFQTDEIKEPGYEKTGGGYNKKSVAYSSDSGEYASSSDKSQTAVKPSQPKSLLEQGFKLLPVIAKSIKFKPQIEYSHADNRRSSAPLDSQQLQHRSQAIAHQTKDLTSASSYRADNNYYQQQQTYEEPGPEFVPGGFVNLQLSGPTGGPKFTYEDYDKERWAQQLSQTKDAMPYPILNYHQLQNFYGGLGTFTNGLADQRYYETSLKDKLFSILSHFGGKLHIG